MPQSYSRAPSGTPQGGQFAFAARAENSDLANEPDSIPSGSSADQIEQYPAVTEDLRRQRNILIGEQQSLQKRIAQARIDLGKLNRRWFKNAADKSEIVRLESEIRDGTARDTQLHDRLADLGRAIPSDPMDF